MLLQKRHAPTALRPTLRLVLRALIEVRARVTDLAGDHIGVEVALMAGDLPELVIRQAPLRDTNRPRPREHRRILHIRRRRRDRPRAVGSTSRARPTALAGRDCRPASWRDRWRFSAYAPLRTAAIGITVAEVRVRRALSARRIPSSTASSSLARSSARYRKTR